eukprot:jgi/Pico_ML_1/54998/g123.t1
MRVTTDDAAELERVLRDVEEQQKTPKSKHEGYGRELVPFFHPGLDTINSKLVTFPKKGQVEGKETESKSNKGKGKGKKEEAGHETNRDGGDAARKKKGLCIGVAVLGLHRAFTLTRLHQVRGVGRHGLFVRQYKT